MTFSTNEFTLFYFKGHWRAETMQLITRKQFYALFFFRHFGLLLETSKKSSEFFFFVIICISVFIPHLFFNIIGESLVLFLTDFILSLWTVTFFQFFFCFILFSFLSQNFFFQLFLRKKLKKERRRKIKILI